MAFLGRFVTILPTYAALLASPSNKAWKRFLLWNAAGGVLWAATFGVGDYEFGGIVTHLGNVSTAVHGACAAVGGIIGYVAMRRYGSQILARAEAAMPESHRRAGPERGSCLPCGGATRGRTRGCRNVALTFGSLDTVS